VLAQHVHRGAVALAGRLGHHDAVGGLLLGSHARQADSQHEISSETYSGDVRYPNSIRDCSPGSRSSAMAGHGGTLGTTHMLNSRWTSREPFKRNWSSTRWSL